MAVSWDDLTTFDRSLYSMKNMKQVFTSKNESDKITSLMYSARRFVITNRAGERLGESMQNYPEYLALNSQFAIPPFETMWVEFDSVNMLQRELLSPFMSDSADMRVGYLFHKGRVYVFSEGKGLMPMLLWLRYELHRPMPINEQLEIADWFGTSRIGLDSFLWGHTLNEFLDPEVSRSLRDSHSIVFTKEGLEYKNHPDYNNRMAQEIYRGSAGELRNILAVLLMVNQPAKFFNVQEVPRQRGIIKGKPMPYFGHSVIDINIDRKGRNLLKRPKGMSAHSSPRWHEVRGHFCHNKEAKSRDHIHNWIEEEPRRWYCSVDGCEARRWWREYPNGHGNAGKGYIKQERKIRTKHDVRSAA